MNWADNPFPQGESFPILPCIGEVYPAHTIAGTPGGLLHHRFTLTPAIAGAVCFLLHLL